MSIHNKNIVIIGPAYPLRGGLASFNERLAHAFKEENHQVKIVTFSLQYPGFLFPGTTQFSAEPAPKDLDISVAINSINPFNWIKMGLRLKKARPDIIVVRYWLPFMGPCLGTICRIVKRNNHTRIVCIADNVIPHEKRLGDKAFTKYFIRPIDAFITMSSKVMADLKTFTDGKPVAFTPHPLYDNFGAIVKKDVAREKIGINKEDKIVLFFGFIRHYKGLDILFDAIKILQDKGFNTQTKFLIAGEFYEDSKPYLDQIKRLGIEDSLILRTSFIPDSEVKNYLCAADVVIQPYRNATQSGVTPLAYHFEVPMIVTHVGGLSALVPDYKVGLISEPTPIALAEKIIEYFELGSSHFISHLQEEKKKYSWDTMVKLIISPFDRL